MIKVFTTTLNSNGEHIHNVGQRVLHKLIKHAGGFQETSLADCDVVFVGTPIMDPYQFNWALADRLGNKKVILFNESDGPFPESEVAEFSEFVFNYPNLRCYFFREWKTGMLYDPRVKVPFVTFDLVDYLNPVTEKDLWMKPPAGRDEFLSRKYDVFHCQSIHVKSRKLLFANIADRKSEKWYASDYYEVRLPFAELMRIQGESKITITIEGAGVKCMRHTEGGINSLICLHDFPMMETYPWIGGHNCLRFPYLPEGGEWNRPLLDIEKAIPYLEDWLSRPDDLYEVYTRCVENAARYSMQNYLQNHIAPTIKAYL